MTIGMRPKAPPESPNFTEEEVKQFGEELVKWVESLPRERLLFWKGMFDSLMYLSTAGSLETLEGLTSDLKESSKRLEAATGRLLALTTLLIAETGVLAVLTLLLVLR